MGFHWAALTMTFLNSPILSVTVALMSVDSGLVSSLTAMPSISFAVLPLTYVPSAAVCSNHSLLNRANSYTKMHR